MSTFLDGFERKDLGPDGGSFISLDAPVLLLHTTEGSTLAAAEDAFAAHPPHFGLSFEESLARQYIDLDLCSFALRGHDSEHVIQVEMVGFAKESHLWSAAKLSWLGTRLRQIATTVGVPSVICPQGFHGEGEGFILASADSPIRFTAAEFRAFSGWCGHQHAPTPDEHWDPGRLDVAALFEEDDMALSDEDKAFIENLIENVVHLKFVQFISDTPTADNRVQPLLGRVLKGKLDTFEEYDAHFKAACAEAIRARAEDGPLAGRRDEPEGGG